MTESEKIVFQAEVIKVQTMTDNAIRVTLDLPEHCTVEMAKLTECKRWGAVLNVTCDPEPV